MERLFRWLTPQRIIYAGVALLLAYVVFSMGYYFPDEHFQILEPVHLRLFHEPGHELTWEYALQMRSGFQPLVAYAVGAALQGAGLYDPFVLAGLLRLLSAALSLAALLAFFRAFREELGGVRWEKWFLLIGFFLWIFAYHHVRFSSETLSANFLLLAVACYQRFQAEPGASPWKWGLWMGLCGGAAFLCRFQVGFCLLGLAAWLLLFGRNRKLLGGFAAGGAIAAAVLLLCDRWFYGVWTLSPWNYVQGNLIDNHMASFGIDPAWEYLRGAILETGLFPGLLFLVSTFWFFWKRPKDLLTWIIVPFLLAHLLVGHKEARFLLPMAFFAPYLIVWFFRQFPLERLNKTWVQLPLRIVVVVNGLLVLFMLVARDPRVHFFRSIYDSCRADGRPTTLLYLPQEENHFLLPEYVLTERLIPSYFYKPANLALEPCADSVALADRIRLAGGRAEPLIVLSKSPALVHQWPSRELDVLPYPAWVARHLNFGGWVERSTRNAIHAYRIDPATPPAQQ